jgi:hypothetical protein
LIARVVKPQEWLEHLLAHLRRNAWSVIDLSDCGNAYDGQDLYRPQRASGDEAERNHGQHQR